MTLLFRIRIYYTVSSLYFSSSTYCSFFFTKNDKPDYTLIHIRI